MALAGELPRIEPGGAFPGDAYNPRVNRVSWPGDEDYGGPSRPSGERSRAFSLYLTAASVRVHCAIGRPSLRDHEPAFTYCAAAASGPTRGRQRGTGLLVTTEEQSLRASVGHP
jgi:hypothetical protein